jgi:hypothetical protein
MLLVSVHSAWQRFMGISGFGDIEPLDIFPPGKLGSGRNQGGSACGQSETDSFAQR